MKTIIDITLPISNGMWSYRPAWQNSVEEIESVLRGGKSTVYHLNLHSHTGTYIETCEHKIEVEKRLDQFGLDSFYGNAKVVCAAADSNNAITLPVFIRAMQTAGMEIKNGDKVIIFSGYGINHQNEDYLKKSPWFSEDLTSFLTEKGLSLLGVDSPIIENLDKPYQPVNKLFEANNNMLLLAPLLMDKTKIESGEYILSCFPFPVKNISGCLCRALLFK
jgi:arylformamidase